MRLGDCALGKNAWAVIFGDGRTFRDTRGVCLPTSCYQTSNRSPKVVNKLGLSFGSTKELNHIIDTVLPGRPAFQCRKLQIGEESLEFYHHDVLDCIRSIYGDPEFAQDLVVTPERHYTDPGWTERVYSEMHTGDWWWAVQVRNTILDME